MNKNSRFGVLALALAGIVGLGYYAYTANRAPLGGAAALAATPAKTGAAPPVVVEVARVKAGEFADEVSAVGNLKARESVVLRPEVPGRISQISFREGVIVDKGSLLVAFDAAIQEAELLQARANRALAQNSHQRNEELLGRKFLSQQALDNSSAALKVQEAALQLAEAKLARMRITAPFKGMLGLRNVSVGDYVKEGEALINIEDISTLLVDFKLPESYLGRISKGQRVEVSSDALPGEHFSAVLDAVDPMIDSGSRAISSRARLDNAAGKLRPGLFVRVSLHFGQRQQVLMVPEEAVVPGAQPAVFKVIEGKAVLTKLRLGMRRAAQVEVVDGLTEGDVVVTAGQLKLHDGSSVQALAPVAAANGRVAGQ